MTWSEWIRAILGAETTRRQQIDDLKLSSYFTAMLIRQKRLPNFMSWMSVRETRAVVGEERDRLRAERKAIDQEVTELLKKRPKRDK